MLNGDWEISKYNGEYKYFGIWEDLRPATGLKPWDSYVSESKVPYKFIVIICIST